jgi:hypothetical protein
MTKMCTVVMRFIEISRGGAGLDAFGSVVRAGNHSEPSAMARTRTNMFSVAGGIARAREGKRRT